MKYKSKIFRIKNGKKYAMKVEQVFKTLKNPINHQYGEKFILPKHFMQICAQI